MKVAGADKQEAIVGCIPSLLPQGLMVGHVGRFPTAWVFLGLGFCFFGLGFFFELRREFTIECSNGEVL